MGFSDKLRKTFEEQKYLILIAAGMGAWLPVIFVSFINDDYQILGFHDEGFFSILKVFWTQDISNVYWRPVGNLFHPLIKTVFGFNPLPYRIFSLTLYIFCSALVMRTSRKIGLSGEASFLAGLLFIVLPSHEFQVAWIADQGESIVTIFLLLSFAYYLDIYFRNEKLKPTAFAIFFFVSALLVKESAYSAIFIPLIAYPIIKPYTKLKTLIKHSVFAILILLVILLYRYFIIGGSPFQSEHFSNKGFINYLINFLIYIPLSFISPELLEQLASNWPIMVLIITVIAVVIMINMKQLKTLSFNDFCGESIGLLWFLAFILPALPSLMRWYVFTASVGMVWAASSLFEKIIKKSQKTRYYRGAILTVIFVLAIFDCTRMLNWQRSGKKMDKIITSIVGLKNDIPSDTLIVWCAPDKVKDVPLMKLGIQQTIQYSMQNNIEVLSPLRAELKGFSSKVNFVSRSDSSIVFRTNNGRFLLKGGRSRSVFKKEFIEQDVDQFRFRIKNDIDRNKIPYSTAEIIFKRPVTAEQIYFDGENFQKIPE